MVILCQVGEEFGEAAVDEAFDRVVAFIKEKEKEEEKRGEGVEASWAATLLDEDEEQAQERRGKGGQGEVRGVGVYEEDAGRVARDVGVSSFRSMNK